MGARTPFIVSGICCAFSLLSFFYSSVIVLGRDNKGVIFPGGGLHQTNNYFKQK
jgi:hypothetical protein